MDESIDSYFDVVVCGTGPAESILAGALARAGKKVLHVDKLGPILVTPPPLSHCLSRLQCAFTAFFEERD